MRSAPSFALLFALLIPNVAAASGDRGELPFQMPPTGGVIVPVFINGQGPFPFLLDTGSARSAITEKLAALLAPPTVSRTLVVSAAGQEMRPVVELTRFDLGPVSRTGLHAFVMRDSRAPFVGIIGQDVLGTLSYTIDYRDRRITWHGDVPDGIAGDAFPLRRSHGRFEIALPQAEGLELAVIPDTGSTDIVLFARADRALPPLLLVEGNAEITTPAGSRRARPARLLELRVGTTLISDRMALIVSRAQTDTLMADGLLPLHLFSRVTFDAARQQVTIER